MTAYRKRPVVVEAVQWFKDGDHPAVAPSHQYAEFPHIHTLEGWMRVSPGDWIITGVAGEFYPCKPDIFAATYEPADAAPVPDDWEADGLLVRDAKTTGPLGVCVRDIDAANLVRLHNAAIPRYPVAALDEIGPILDAWDAIPNDFQQSICSHCPDLALHLNRLSETVPLTK